MSTLRDDGPVELPLLSALNPAVGSVTGMLPCYNDEGTISLMVYRLRHALAGTGVPFELIVVDDGSTDGSAEILDGLVTTVPELRVVRHERNRGYGGVLQSGFGAARFDWVFYTDGDGQYDPAELLDLVRLASDDVDWVQGWKIARGDAWSRRVIGRSYHHVVRILFGAGIRDTDCDFRLIRRSLLDHIRLRTSSGAVCAEMVFKCRRAGARVVETPVHHYERPVGRSQFFRLPHVARTVGDVVLLWWRLVVLGRPDA